MLNGYLNTPFSIFATPRPRRIAFLIDPENASDELMDAIFNFNLLHWGGRYNPIIPVFNGTISDTYWQLLTFCDPDIIYSFPKLDNELIQKIDRWIAPFHFICHKDYPGTKHSISVTNTQLGIEYFMHRIRKSHSPFVDEPTLLVCHNSNKWKHYKFFHRNFGVYHDKKVFSPQLPPGAKTLVIDENSEPDKFFSKMATTQELVFPIQLSEMDTDFQEALNSSKYDNFCLVIGDSLWDWIYFWNRIFLLPKWRRSKIFQLCLPLSFIESDQIVDSLKKFLSSQLYRTSSQPPTVLLASHDLGEDVLERIAKKITENIDAYPTIMQLTKNLSPTIAPRDVVSTDTQGSTRHFHVYGRKVFIQNPKPTFLEVETSRDESLSTGKTWMLDLKIQYRPESFFYTNANYWWRLPKCAGIARLFARYRPGRIANNGLISIEINERDKNIELNIPYDESVIYSMLIGERTYHYTDDIREKGRSTPYGDLCISDKGRYLRGFIELFPSLRDASDFVNNHYWRSILESLCRRSIEEEDKKIKPIKKKIDKIIPSFIKDYSNNPEAKKQWLAKYILNQAKQQKSVITEIDFATLLQKFTEERRKFTEKQRDKDYETTKEQDRQNLIDAMSYLIELSIFFQGVKPRCPVCGSSFWYHVEEIESNMVCKGCRSKLSLPIESKWVYRLNELVTNAVSFHGVIPVIWTLGHLLSRCDDSFIFTPNFELFKDYGSKSSLAEIDLVCITDSNLVIGEVKSSVDEFNSAEIEKLASVCKYILPEKAIIAAFQGSHNKLDKFAKELCEKLKPLEIKVEAITPDSCVFEPSYHI